MSATHQKKLHTGQSVWSTGRVRLPHAPKLETDISCDVIVVGAGISGALLAESLTERRLDVVIVDRRDDPFVATDIDEGRLHAA
jgi:NADPH-dependent 2,4-dienoyl-CoA reductase/sulfur reductase-like enzyme